MKKERHEAIIKLIENEVISTQEDLMQRLSQIGFKATQATVSRDIKLLGLVKSTDENGNYRYTPPKVEDSQINSKFLSVFSNSVISLVTAGNIVAVKCFSGMASAAAAALDTMANDQVVATLAGDDTIFVLCKDEAAAKEFEAIGNKYLFSEND